MQIREQLSSVDAGELSRRCVEAGLQRGAFVALVVAPGGVGIHLPSTGDGWAVEANPAAVVAELESHFRPRWIWWSNETPRLLLEHGVRLATCWDLAAAHRLLFGGWSTDPARIWGRLHDLADDTVPAVGQLDLLGDHGNDGGDAEEPIRPDGHLRPEWISGGWSRNAKRLSVWARVAAEACALQLRRLDQVPGGRAAATARSESAAELLCAELGFDGLPIDLVRADELLTSFVGPRPNGEDDARENRRRRDDEVRRLMPGVDVDLRSPAQVKAALAGIGIEVSDTRSWRLELFRGAHPAVEALLKWRKDERFATTYGYDWLDRFVGADGRLRGTWTGCDGGAGRMTASAGLHNMPAEFRPAVAAAPDYKLVRADLGQVEPRVLAAISGDRALAAATADDDLYAPVAARLGVERSVAKVAVLAAMYGQTSGAAGQALQGLESAYPVAMRYLRSAYDSGRAGRDVHTYGGRLVRMWPTPANLSEEQERANVAARGRFARNAVVQGAAAELFKAWAVTVRARALPLGATIVLCLHDELLVHSPAIHADRVAQLLHECLDEAALRWTSPGAPSVRMVADVSVVQRWSEAKQ